MNVQKLFTRVNRKRRGISPIIAVLLLIVLVVFASAIIFFVMTQFFQGQFNGVIKAIAAEQDTNNNRKIDHIEVNVQNLGTGGGNIIGVTMRDEDKNVEYNWAIEGDSVSLDPNQEKTISLDAKTSDDELPTNSRSVAYQILLKVDTNNDGADDVEIASSTYIASYISPPLQDAVGTIKLSNVEDFERINETYTITGAELRTSLGEQLDVSIRIVDEHGNLIPTIVNDIDGDGYINDTDEVVVMVSLPKRTAGGSAQYYIIDEPASVGPPDFPNTYFFRYYAYVRSTGRENHQLSITAYYNNTKVRITAYPSNVTYTITLNEYEYFSPTNFFAEGSWLVIESTNRLTGYNGFYTGTGNVWNHMNPIRGRHGQLLDNEFAAYLWPQGSRTGTAYQVGIWVATYSTTPINITYKLSTETTWQRTELNNTPQILIPPSQQYGGAVLIVKAEDPNAKFAAYVSSVDDSYARDVWTSYVSESGTFSGKKFYIVQPGGGYSSSTNRGLHVIAAKNPLDGTTATGQVTIPGSSNPTLSTYDYWAGPYSTASGYLTDYPLLAVNSQINIILTYVYASDDIHQLVDIRWGVEVGTELVGTKSYDSSGRTNMITVFSIYNGNSISLYRTYGGSLFGSQALDKYEIWEAGDLDPDFWPYLTSTYPIIVYQYDDANDGGGAIMVDLSHYTLLTISVDIST